MTAHKQRKPKLWQLPVESLSFGGWGNYQTWSDNDFQPRPQVDDPVTGPEAPDVVTEQRTADDAAERAAAMAVRDSAASAVDGAPEDSTPESDRSTADLAGDGPVGVTWPDEEPDAEPPFVDVVVRPYVRTNGRTRPAYDLRLESMVAATHLEERVAMSLTLTPDLQKICEICRVRSSVAEVAAHLSVPVGAVRVLLSDAIDAGLVLVYESQLRDDGRPPLELLHRVYDGLRKLA